MNKLNDAVNICLQTIGEQTLSVGQSVIGIHEAEQALSILDQETTTVLSKGLNCNTDDAWKLLPDTNGYIAVPSIAIRVDSNQIDVIVKDGKLYDKSKMSYKFESAVIVDIIWDIPFDDLPYAVQYYVTLRAARILYQRLVGDASTLQVLLQDEEKARLDVIDHDVDTKDYNIFDNSTNARLLNRTKNPKGLRG